MYEKLQNVHFIKNRKIYYAISAALIIIMIAVGLIRGYNWGIDFTGGTLLELGMGKTVELSDVKDVLDDNDLDGTVIYSGDNNEGIIIKTADSMDTEVRSALMDDLMEKFDIDEDALISVSNIGPSVGRTLRDSALKSVAAAVVLMLIYIAIRFMIKYGIAAILALANTILLMIGFYGAFHITINSPFIAAVLTVLGYGINDTIVIFDRIREHTGGRHSRRSVEKLPDLIDESIRQTVGRSIMTSITTLAVMIPILIICGDTIKSFILPILVGVISSTCSSIFIAPSLWYDIMKLTDKDSYEYKMKQKEKDKKKSDKKKEKIAAEKKKQKEQKEASRQKKLEERQKALEAEAEKAAKEAAAEEAGTVAESAEDEK